MRKVSPVLCQYCRVATERHRGHFDGLVWNFAWAPLLGRTPLLPAQEVLEEARAGAGDDEDWTQAGEGPPGDPATHGIRVQLKAGEIVCKADKLPPTL